MTEATSGTLTVLPDQKIELDGTVTDMLASDNPQVHYGINTRTQKLYYIDPTIPEITDQFDLPCVNPRNLAYSASDKQLFIATERGNILALSSANCIKPAKSCCLEWLPQSGKGETGVDQEKVS